MEKEGISWRREGKNSLYTSDLSVTHGLFVARSRGVHSNARYSHRLGAEIVLRVRREFCITLPARFPFRSAVESTEFRVPSSDRFAFRSYKSTRGIIILSAEEEKIKGCTSAFAPEPNRLKTTIANFYTQVASQWNERRRVIEDRFTIVLEICRVEIETKARNVNNPLDNPK